MEQNVLVTKMIGIVVAVIVAAVVLVPICNSLTEGDGGSGDNGGSAPVQVDGDVLNSLNTVLADDKVETTYTGYESYYVGKSGSGPSYSFTLSDAQGYMDAFEKVGNMYYDSVSVPIMRLKASHSDYDRITLTLNVVTYKSDGSKAVTVSGNFLDSTGTNAPVSIGGLGGATIDSFQTFSITANSNMTATIDIIGTSVNLQLTGVSIIKIDYVTESDNCWVPFFVAPTYPILYVEEGSAFMLNLSLRDGSATDLKFYTVDVTSDMIEDLQVQTTITNTFESEDYEIVLTINLTQYDDGIGLTGPVSVNVSGDYNLNWNVVSEAYYVSAMNANPSAGSSGGDSSGGSSDLGVAGTIIGIIPVFVILAILMGAAGLFYQNRKTI